MSDSNLREIITLQIGHYANYVGTHWWNFQEASFVYDEKAPTDLNHCYFFQSGLTQMGVETFTPRLLIVDAQGSLGSLSRCGTLYKTSTTNATSQQQVALWDDTVTTVHQIPTPKNEFLKDLEDEEKILNSTQENYTSCPAVLPPPKVYDLLGRVHYWSDFLRPHLHPDTLFMLPGVWHSMIGGPADALAIGQGNNCGRTAGETRTGSNNEGENSTSKKQHTMEQDCSFPASSMSPEQLWSYNAGVEAAATESSQEAILDSIRRLAERCNSVQGFQVLCHSYDGMGGVAAVQFQQLRDEYSSKALLAVPITTPATAALNSAAHTLLLANTLMTYSNLCEHSDLLLPLSLRQHAWQPHAPLVTLPLYTVQPWQPYESSSLLAAFLECASSAVRSRCDSLQLGQLAHYLAPRGRKVVCGRLQMPALSSVGAGGVGVSGGPEALPPYLAQVTARRGHDSGGVSESSAGVLVQLRDPIHTRSPFPMQLFTGIPITAGVNIDSVSCEASLQQGTACDRLVQELLVDCRQLRPVHVAKLASYGLTEDEWQETVETWQQLTECYGEGTREAEDSDE